MVSTTTPNYGWVKPSVGGDSTTWGGLLNNDLDAIDAAVFQAAEGVLGLGTVLVAPNQIVLNSTPAPAINQIYGQANGVARWAMFLGNGEAETGSNAGSNFLLQSYSDSGSFLTNSFEIIRATGAASFGGALGVGATLTVNGAAYFGGTLNVNGALTGNSAASFSGSGSFNGGLNVSSAASFYGTVGMTSTLYVAGAVTFASALSVSTTINAGSGITGSAFGVAGTNTYLGYRTLGLDTNCSITWTGGGLNFNGSSGSMAEMDPGGTFYVTSKGYQPGGGSWGSISDARVKTVERPYALGLSEILKLEPIVYRYRANEAAPGKASKLERFKDKSFVGLVAQDVEQIFPGMVTQRKGWVDGQEVDNFRDLDTSELVFALVNAVKTLTARVQELEAR